ncbi:putative endonuclease [Gluconacetobacter azotocaptans DSM 13594]|nr:restriction endonuclease [Gluconacetobacter azotocaptans]GBQ32177.1 putative endonuclease [Gluconacetobacter azotocaptans DSM 13594]
MTVFLSCLGLNLLSSSALAEDLYHVTAPIYACVNPRATKALANKEDPRQHDMRWVRFVIQDGRCFQISPNDTWEAISEHDGIKLLRHDPPVSGMPPLYFLADQLASGLPAPPEQSPSVPEDQAPHTSTDDPAVSPVQPEAGSAPPADSSGAIPSAAAAGRNSDQGVAQEAPSTPSPGTAPAAPADSGGHTGLIILLMGALGLLGLQLRKKAIARRRLEGALAIVNTEIDRQSNALQIRKLQLATPDHYGTINLAKWQKEIGYFCESRLLTFLTGNGLGDQWPLIAAQTAQRVDAIASAEPSRDSTSPQFVSDPRTFDPRMDPIDYERHCAFLLQQAGWDARVTQASGDQGADVIAERRGQKIVVQCKLYGQPVGNKAVQEAFAAKEHQRAHVALVASNAEFTPSARQLASTTGVILMHHSQLAQFRI